MAINFDTIKNKINQYSGDEGTGGTFSIILHDGTTPQYDVDQNSIYQITGTSRYAWMRLPSKQDTNSSGGLITLSTRKFIFSRDFNEINIVVHF